MTDDALAPHPDSADGISPGLSRRAIVAGAGAAWAAPAITVLASAPAFATSGQVQVTAFLPDATRPVSAYQRGTTQNFTATLTRGTTTTPVATGTAVVFTLDRLPGDTTSATDLLSLHPTTTAATATTTTDASGQATITVRYLPAVVPTLPTTLRLTATTTTGSATLATWNLTYRPARPGSTDSHGAYAITTSSEASYTLVHRNGRGYAFGSGSTGSLGQGSFASSSSPVAIAAEPSLAGRTISGLAPGCVASHSAVVTSDGAVHTWGLNSNGQLATGTTASRLVPGAVATSGSSLAGKTVASVSSGNGHILALASDGTVHAWGNNASGQVGDGSGIQRTAPVAVTTPGNLPSMTNIVAVAAGGSFSLALHANGAIRVWGDNGNGQLGDGTTISRSGPSAMPTSLTSLAGKAVTAIAAGSSHSLALASDGTVHAWGNNANGQLGDGSTAQRNVPVAVSSLAGKTITAIAAGSSHSLALASDGTLYAWGQNVGGQLGDGTTLQRSAPVPVTTAGTSLAGKTVVAIAAGGIHSLALASDGSLHAWGSNSNGQLGDGTSAAQRTPVAVATLGTSLEGKTITAVTAGNSHTLAVASDGTLHAWGQNANGRLGDGTIVDRATATAIDGTSLAGRTITALSTGQSHSLALTADGTAHTWGSNTNGRLGDGTTLNRPTAGIVTTVGTPLAGRTITAVAAGNAHNLVLTAEGTAHAWGLNTSGQLGDGTVAQRAIVVPVTVTGTPLERRTLSAIAAGAAHSLALASDGTLHAWGNNANGQLGDGTTTNRTEPVAVRTAGTSLEGKTIVAISAGNVHSLALASDGTLHAWGNNLGGQLGDGTLTQRTTAVEVRTTGTSLDRKTPVTIATGAFHSVVLASDGTIHAWGDNTDGQLGDGTLTQRTSAVAVTVTTSLADKKIVAIAAGALHSLALASDGTIHGWGSNSLGQLGDGSTARRITPVLVNALPG